VKLFENWDLGVDAVGSGTFSDRLSEMFVVRFASTLGLDTTTVNDAGSTRIVVIVTLLLIVLGIGLGVLNVWFWKQTKPDPEALGPLVEMSSRKFAELEPIEQRLRLDQLRPSLALPPVNELSAEIEQPDPFEVVPVVDDPVVEQDAVVVEVAISSSEPTRPISANEIDWDDDEWPDVDDWSLPGEKARQPELFDQDQEDELDFDVAPEVPKEQPKKGPVSIDPLLGF
jgi:hypothetical protein